MTKILTKLTKIAIFPSILLVIIRFGGIYFTAALLGLEYEILEDRTKIIPWQIIVHKEIDIILLNTVTIIAMYTVILLGIIFLFYKLHFLQDKRITPKKVIRLAERQELRFIETSLNIYIKTVVWVLFLWIITILAVIYTINQGVDLWVGFITSIITLACTYILVKNIGVDYTDDTF